MTDDELIEKMAEAIWNTSVDRSWKDDLRDRHWYNRLQIQRTRDEARAALTALREAGYEVTRRKP